MAWLTENSILGAVAAAAAGTALSARDRRRIRIRLHAVQKQRKTPGSTATATAGRRARIDRVPAIAAFFTDKAGKQVVVVDLSGSTLGVCPPGPAAAAAGTLIYRSS
ncbi:hypothetical protein [Phyllobacterium phragmitis]|uniref:hypothetical protein n=1 Tax=Phyllobacterium phragmitis TaxID=2670329 RepID=UPI001AECE40B|nr:hypothetical protein [Phyllobacterium phragmitis]